MEGLDLLSYINQRLFKFLEFSQKVVVLVLLVFDLVRLFVDRVIKILELKLRLIDDLLLLFDQDLILLYLANCRLHRFLLVLHLVCKFFKISGMLFNKRLIRIYGV